MPPLTKKNPGRHVCNDANRNTVEQRLNDEYVLVTEYRQCSICLEHQGQTSEQKRKPK